MEIALKTSPRVNPFQALGEVFSDLTQPNRTSRLELVSNT